MRRRLLGILAWLATDVLHMPAAGEHAVLLPLTLRTL